MLFRGEVDDAELAREYAGCDVFCLPARYESFGLVLVEAMSHGKPVVACRAGGMPEVVADGRTGLLVEPDSLPALVAAIRQLATDAGLRATLGAAGRREYEDRFTVAAMVRGTLAAFAAATAAEPATAGRRGLGLVA